MSRTPRAWPRQDGGGGASAPTSRSPSGPPSRVAARPQQARVRPPSRPPPWGRSTGRRRTEVSQAARATAPEAQGGARSVRSHCADASHPGPRGHGRCIERGVAQSSAAQSSSPRRHPRSCAPALTTRSPESAASRSDPGPTGASLPDPLRSDDQQPAPWLASATHGASAYPLINNPGILNPSPSPGPRIMHQETVERVCELLYEAAAVSEMWPKALAALADATGAVNAHFVLWSQRENKTQFFASANPDQGWETLYNTYYGAIAPCRGLLDDRVVGDWVASHRYFDQAFVRSSEYFNDFLLRIGGLYSVKGRVFETGSRDVYAIAGVLRSPKAGPLDDAEIARLAASLNGHLRRAAALHHKLAAARPNGRLLESAIDRL